MASPDGKKWRSARYFLFVEPESFHESALNGHRGERTWQRGSEPKSTFGLVPPRLIYFCGARKLGTGVCDRKNTGPKDFKNRAPWFRPPPTRTFLKGFVFRLEDRGGAGVTVDLRSLPPVGLLSAGVPNAREGSPLKLADRGSGWLGSVPCPSRRTFGASCGEGTGACADKSRVGPAGPLRP